MTTKGKITGSLVALVTVFLLGFVPQYVKTRQAQAELAIAVEKLKMSELRDLAGLMLLEVLRQNYGTARDDAAKYFNELQETFQQTDDAGLKASLLELLRNRDAVTTALSNADPAVASQLQAILARTQAITKTP